MEIPDQKAKVTWKMGYFAPRLVNSAKDEAPGVMTPENFRKCHPKCQGPVSCSIGYLKSLAPLDCSEEHLPSPI